VTKVRSWRVLVSVVLAAMVATACGGGGGDAGGEASGAAGGEETTAAAGGETEEEAAAGGSGEPVPGVTEDTIRLGTTLPITGPAAVAGEGLVAGISIAVEEVNAAGGIDGRTVELVALDDAFDPPRLVANARRLITEEQVYAMASPAGSQALPGIWEFVADAGTIVWGPVSPKDPQIQQVYILGPGRGQQLHICTDYAAEQGLTKIGLIGQDNELGAEGNEGVEAAVEANEGLEYVGFERVEVLSQEVSSAVLNLRDAGAEAIMLATDNTQASLVMQQADQLGMDVMLCADNGGGGTGGPNSVGPAGAAADGFIGALQQQLPSSEDNEAVAEWRALAEEYSGQGSGQALSNFSLQTYYYTRGLFEILDRLEGDLAYENFHAEAESLADDPLDLGALPALACGPLPDGHSCANGAALAEYDAEAEEWNVIRDFQPASGSDG
jgi:branched-chain amino acid transport system substrate-binding protein